MARKSLMIFLVVLIIFSANDLASYVNGRKVMLNMKDRIVPSLEETLYLESLPKGKVPASTPSKKNHDVTFDEKLVARHLAALDRILRSVPSPGVGH